MAVKLDWSIGTIYFKDYIDLGYPLPPALANVPALDGMAFTDLFKEKFAMYEIGYETCSWFYNEISFTANLKCPFYTKLITKYNTIIDNALGLTTTSETYTEDNGSDETENAVTDTTGNSKNQFYDMSRTGTMTAQNLTNETDITINSVVTGNRTMDRTGTKKYNKNISIESNDIEELDKWINTIPDLYERLIEQFTKHFYLIRGKL